MPRKKARKKPGRKRSSRARTKKTFRDREASFNKGYRQGRRDGRAGVTRDLKTGKIKRRRRDPFDLGF